MYSREELKEMLDSVINSNGVKGITGDGLNAVLSAIVDSVPAIYRFPSTMGQAISDNGSYIFTPEEREAFLKAWANKAKMRFVYEGYFEGFATDIVIDCFPAYYDEDAKGYYFMGGGSQYWLDNGFYSIFIEDNNDPLIAYFE